MNSIINEDVLRKLYDSKKFNDEMYAFISETLDSELLKDENELDCDLICWCTNALIELEKESDDSFAVILPLFSDNQFLNSAKRFNFKSLSRGSRALIAACLTMFFAVTANAAVAEIFDYNIAHEIASAIQERIDNFKNNNTLIEEEQPSAVPNENPVKKEEPTTQPITESTTQATAAKRVQKSTPAAAVKKDEPQNESTTKAGNTTVAENKVVITGIQGEAPKKLVYTTDDTALDLTGLRLRYVYSDNSYSAWFNESSAKIVKNIDFTKIGEQEIVLKINNSYEYRYKILLKNVEVKDDTIKSVKLGHTGCVNFTFFLNEEPDLSNLYLDVTYLGGKKEEIYYENCSEMSVVGINTSIETLSDTKQFTVYYKGFTVTGDYIVKNRNNEVYYARIRYYGDRSNIEYRNPFSTKTLYYYGEPLSAGNGIKPDSEQLDLISCDPFVGNDKPLDYHAFDEIGFTIMAKNVSGSGYVFYDSDELDIRGYDPYQLGFQTLDVYYNGMYLLSYNVFVYGDDGFCPSNTIDAFVDYGDESQLTVKEWYRCIGGGRLQSKRAYLDELQGEEFNREDYINARKNSIYEAMIHSSVAELEDSEKVGWQNAKCTFNEEYSYDLKVSQRYLINGYRFDYGDPGYFSFNMNDLESPDFGNATVTLKINNLGEITYPINDFRTVPRIVIDGTDVGSIIDSSLELESAFIVYQLLPDKTAYRFNDRATFIAPDVPAFVYADGFEDSITFNIAERSDWENIFDINETEQSLLNRYGYYLEAKNNKLCLDTGDFCPSQANVKGISFGQTGEYDAVFYTTYNGRVYETSRQITIVENIVTPTLEAVYDENQQRPLLQGHKYDTDNIRFVYTNRRGEQIEITAKDTIISKTGVDDWGYITAQPGDTFRVDYTYKGTTCFLWYHCWGKVTNINTVSTKSGLMVSYKDNSFSDYYEITCGDTTITTSELKYIIDKSCITEEVGFVYITPHVIIDGEDIAGVKIGIQYTYRTY